MKILLGLVALFPVVTCLSQVDSSTRKLIFFEDFNNNKNSWTVGDNKNANTSIVGGIYYLAATGPAYGEAREVDIDTRKDFEIETRIKILSGNAEHKNHYSMLFWWQ